MISSINPFADDEFKKQIIEQEGLDKNSPDNYEILEPIDENIEFKNIISNTPKIPKQAKNIILDASALAKNDKEAKAQELNLKHTHFITPHGLDEEGHYTTGYELALIADYALNIEKIAEGEKVPPQSQEEDEEDDDEDDEETQEAVIKAAALLEDAILRKQAAEAVYNGALEDMEIVASVISDLGGSFEKFAEVVVEEMEK
jgi:hypothetical protein